MVTLVKILYVNRFTIHKLTKISIGPISSANQRSKDGDIDSAVREVTEGARKLLTIATECCVPCARETNQHLSSCKRQALYQASEGSWGCGVQRE